MKLYVEEKDMPPNCAECKAEGHYENSYGDEYGFFCPFGYKAYTSGTRDTKRLDNCPLVPVPPHGRLGDLDEIERYKERLVVDADKIKPRIRYVVDIKYIKEAPTIIQADPAEGGEL